MKLWLPIEAIAEDVAKTFDYTPGVSTVALFPRNAEARDAAFGLV